jgi:hypothetical protein
MVLLFLLCGVIYYVVGIIHESGLLDKSAYLTTAGSGIWISIPSCVEGIFPREVGISRYENDFQSITAEHHWPRPCPRHHVMSR